MDVKKNANKKRRLPEITKEEEFEKPMSVPKTTDVRECAFNPFGNDECDMCGA